MRRFLIIYVLLSIIFTMSLAGGEEIRLSEYVVANAPNPDYAKLYPNRYVRLAAKALRQWFVTEGDLPQNFLTSYEQTWSHQRIILSDPQVFLTNEVKPSEKLVIYCMATINAYSLFQPKSSDLKQVLLKEDYEQTWLFRIEFNILIDHDEYEFVKVHPITDGHEELYPGAGFGEDGFPGLSEKIKKKLNERCWSADYIAKDYIKINELNAEIIPWAETIAE